MKLWQLKKLSTNQNLSEPQELPENWNGIFGLMGFKEKLDNLSWAGHSDMGWFEVEVADPTPIVDHKTVTDEKINELLRSSLEYVAADNIDMTKSKRLEWVEYRKKLKEVVLQVGYPSEINWPKRPD